MRRNEYSKVGLDKEYREGRWSFLGNIPEMSRHGIITSWLTGTNNTKTILDIGCGEGYFYERIEHLGLKKYYGIDISSEAIKSIKKRINLEIAQVKCIDLTKFSPRNEKFNAIIFNEVLNYVDDATNQINRYSKFLEPNGVIAISIYTPNRRDSGAHERVEEIWSQIRDNGWNIMDEISLTSHIKEITWRMIFTQPNT